MSFALGKDVARSISGEIQVDKTDGMDGGASSPVYAGSSTSGVTEKEPVSEMTTRRTTAKTATSSLRRKYASTGSGG
jgi:hypothetical protein